MFRKFSETFTATHLTVIIVAALVVPGVLYAAVTFSSVAITDPNSGKMAAVDKNHRLYTYNPVEAYTNNPANLVNITALVQPNGSLTTIYTVPANQALIIKDVSFDYFANTDGGNCYLYLYDFGNNILFNFEGLRVAESLSDNFQSGIIVHAGILQASYTGPSASAARVYIQGYLVPAGALPEAFGMQSQFVTGRVPRRGRPQ